MTNLTSKASYEGVYNPTSSAQVIWKEVATTEWTNIQVAALQTQIDALKNE
ncbi:hypothetical protein [Listeria booriae]|uniref:hypothetical protein n=1 Tax=Listeria booriae TaxID=1552123 RepID=UPI00164D0021|nr:hypothetical protein [Listeria booriae]